MKAHIVFPVLCMLFICPTAAVRAAPYSDDLDAGGASREVKYTAGADGSWFTGDDEVYHFFTAEYDDRGRMTRKSCLKAGPDRLPGTPDDELQEYQVYSVDPDVARVSEDSLYDSAGVLKAKSFYYFDMNGNKIREVRADADKRIVRVIDFEYEDGIKGPVLDIERASKGPDGSWGTADDEIEKYHRREYGPQGIVRMKEYHRDHAGRGADGKWFTADDVVSSTKEFVYGPSGKVEKVLKCVAPGPDGMWFTGDEVMQYYTVRGYGPFLYKGETNAWEYHKEE